MQAVTTIGLDIAPRIRLMAFDLGTCCVVLVAHWRQRDCHRDWQEQAVPRSHRPIDFACDDAHPRRDWRRERVVTC